MSNAEQGMRNVEVTATGPVDLKLTAMAVRLEDMARRNAELRAGLDEVLRINGEVQKQLMDCRKQMRLHRDLARGILPMVRVLANGKEVGPGDDGTHARDWIITAVAAGLIPVRDGTYREPFGTGSPKSEV